MSVTKRDAVCPFPEICEFWGPEGCSIKTAQNPLIFCSMAEIKKDRIDFSETEVKEYLDRHIMVWEGKRRYTRSEFATFFVDAYQKVRKDIFGEELKIPEVLKESNPGTGGE